MFPTDLILSKVMHLFISAEVETFSFDWKCTNMSFCACACTPTGARSRFLFINALNLTWERKKKKIASMTWNYIISVITLVGNVIKLCNPVSKVPVCMADQAKLLVAALQYKCSVNYMQLKSEQSQCRNRGLPTPPPPPPLPGIGWLWRAPGWLIPRLMTQFGCSLQCCLREQGWKRL